MDAAAWHLSDLQEASNSTPDTCIMMFNLFPRPTAGRWYTLQPTGEASRYVRDRGRGPASDWTLAASYVSAHILIGGGGDGTQ
jgi:hypothetical protein